jgi:tRNA nucleotidyltransferase (CCA-adding enzyme)
VEKDLADLLKKKLPSQQLDLIQRVADEASKLGFPIYIVGGFVRDLLLGHPSLDFDFVVEGDAPGLADSLASKYGGKVTIHEKFRTAKIDIREWRLDTGNYSLISIDLISARSETYTHPAALPTVEMGTISDDIHRRDFTINTLAIRLDGDHFGKLHVELDGDDDLQNGLVRVLHSQSFIDDPTRIYRAVRYEQRYGFKIAKETLALLPEARQYISELSPQRIRHELDLILDEPKAILILARLDELDLLQPIHSALHFDKQARARFESAHIESLNVEVSNIADRDLYWLFWLMTLSSTEITSLNKRLHFTAPLLESLLASSKLFANLSAFGNLKPSQCVERLDKLPLPAIYAVSIASRRGKSKRALEQYVSEWRHVKPKTTGNDLKKLGLEPGPKYQSILRKLRNAWLDGEVKNNAEEKALLEKLIS